MKEINFKEKAIKKHLGKYTYDKTKYIDSHTSIIITCPIHGDFSIRPAAHLQGQGCKKCGIINRKPKKDTKQFKEEAVNKWGNKYDYTLTEYINKTTKITLGSWVN